MSTSRLSIILSATALAVATVGSLAALVISLSALGQAGVGAEQPTRAVPAGLPSTAPLTGPVDFDMEAAQHANACQMLLESYTWDRSTGGDPDPMLADTWEAARCAQHFERLGERLYGEGR